MASYLLTHEQFTGDYITEENDSPSKASGFSGNGGMMNSFSIHDRMIKGPVSDRISVIS